MFSSNKNKAKKSKVSDESAAEALFLSLADPEDPQIISMEGIASLCERLGK